MQGDKGINRKIIKNWFYFQVQGGNTEIEIERYRENIEIFKNLERKRY